MIDTYEQMTALDHWMRELARSLPKNVLLVIASRTVPTWDRSWQNWLGRAEVVELKEMTPDDLRTLVHRYYTYIRSGDPDPKQVEAIVQFARGLPMVATTVVQLWVKYGIEDFQTVRPQVVADLVDRLLEGVPQACGQRLRQQQCYATSTLICLARCWLTATRKSSMSSYGGGRSSARAGRTSCSCDHARDTE